DAARALGPRLVLVTSLQREDGVAGTVEMLAVGPDGAWLVATPLLDLSVNGAGDATAALFLAHYLKSGSAERALVKTAASVFAVMEATLAAGVREIQLIAAQDVLADPPDRFPARQIR
ncbi:MAG: pyridoxal kinase, partial [Rhodospirillaceae bacterium]|nr:pyridoxal kinase [Rhodospirillaceae bacterium]